VAVAASGDAGDDAAPRSVDRAWTKPAASSTAAAGSGGAADAFGAEKKRKSNGWQPPRQPLENMADLRVVPRKKMGREPSADTKRARDFVRMNKAGKYVNLRTRHIFGTEQQAIKEVLDGSKRLGLPGIGRLHESGKGRGRGKWLSGTGDDAAKPPSDLKDEETASEDEETSDHQQKPGDNGDNVGGEGLFAAFAVNEGRLPDRKSPFFEMEGDLPPRKKPRSTLGDDESAAPKSRRARGADSGDKDGAVPNPKRKRSQPRDRRRAGAAREEQGMPDAGRPHGLHSDTTDDETSTSLKASAARAGRSRRRHGAGKDDGAASATAGAHATDDGDDDDDGDSEAASHGRAAADETAAVSTNASGELGFPEIVEEAQR